MPVTRDNDEKTNHDSMEIYIVIAIALVIIVSGAYFYNTSEDEQPKPIPVQDPAGPIQPEQMHPTATLPPEEPLLPPEPEMVIEPIPESKPIIKLPSLDNSDTIALIAAQQLSWLPTYTTVLTTKDIIRNFVTFIDNLSRGELASKFSPLVRPADKFSVIEVAQEVYLNEKSYNRYDIYVDIINSINVEFALNQYETLEPLFDAAYRELGYPEHRFKSTLYQAIEMVINAPIIREPIKLVAPSVMYKFADPELEQLPSAHKLMIRMGPDNIIKLRAKLQQIQLALATN